MCTGAINTVGIMVNTLEETINKLKKEIASDSANILDSRALEAFRIKYLGEKSFLANQQKNIRNISKEAFDITLPGIYQESGQEHPLSMVTNEIVDIFHGRGFTKVDGPEVETDFYNFTALNTPPDHPARDEQDTFYTNISPHVLLRSHTSTVQIRTLEKNPPPLRILAHGRVYRNEEINARKMPFFHQLEILAVEKRSEEHTS